MLKIFWRNKKTFTLLLICFSSVFCLSLALGQIDIPLSHTLNIIGWQLQLPFFEETGFTAEEKAILWHIRMPRTLVGLMTGAALAVSGSVMQGVFGNPLADPGIVGVSSGAATGAVLAIALGIGYTNLFYMPLFAFAGAICAVGITLMLAMRNGKVPVMTLLLAGVAVSMILGALTSGILTFINEQKLQQYLFWMVGGLDYRRWEHVYLAFWPIMTGIFILVLLSRHLNVLALGEIEAKAVGMRVVPFRIALLLIASMTTASAVCVSGNIGFVGLVVPHIMRIFVGPDHRILLPASILAGGTFLVFCDTLGRRIISPAEIRVGIMTAILGAPYFLYLLQRMRE